MQELQKKWKQQEEEVRRSSTLEATRSLEERVPNFPGAGAVRELIRDYRAVLRPEAYANPQTVGASNAGLNSFTRALGQRDPKFGAAVAAFYREIRELDEKRPRVEAGPQLPLGQRAALSQVTNQPGWLWKLALKHSGGNANDALRMIGICGHDDVSQASTLVDVSREQQEKRYTEQLKSLEQQIVQARENRDKMMKELKGAQQKGSEPGPWGGLLFKPISADMKKWSDQWIKNLEMMKQNLSPEQFASEVVTCPVQTSDFYLPRSLGADFDISGDLKRRIVKAQAPSDLDEKNRRKPGASIPAKHYHVYGAALVACEMIARGHNPSLVSFISGLLGYAYRTERMNSLARSAQAQSGNQMLMPMFTLTDDQLGAQYDALKQIQQNLKKVQKFNSKSTTQNGNLPQIPGGGLGMGQGFGYGGIGGEEVKVGEHTPSPASGMMPYGYPGGFGAGAGFSFEGYSDEMEGMLYDEDNLPLSGYGGGGLGAGFGAGFSYGGIGTSTEIPKPNPSASPNPYPAWMPPKPMHEMSKAEYIDWMKKQQEISAKHMAENFDKQTKRRRELADAVELMRRWTLSDKLQIGNKTLFELPYNSIRIPMPEAFEGTVVDRAIHRKPDGWADERFDRAKKRFKSMLIDWEWTSEQHSVGGKFAATVCKPEAKPAGGPSNPDGAAGASPAR